MKLFNIDVCSKILNDNIEYKKCVMCCRCFYVCRLVVSRASCPLVNFVRSSILETLQIQRTPTKCVRVGIAELSNS